MPSCSVIGCGRKKSKNHPSLSLHRLPAQEQKQKKWLEALGVHNISTIVKDHYICSSHFNEDCFNRTLDVMRLRDDAVPNKYQSPYTEKSTAATVTDKHHLSTVLAGHDYLGASNSTRDPLTIDLTGPHSPPAVPKTPRIILRRVTVPQKTAATRSASAPVPTSARVPVPTSAPVPTPAHVSVPTSAPTPTSSRVPVPTSSRVPVPTSAPVPASAPVPTSAPVSDVVSALLNLKPQKTAATRSASAPVPTSARVPVPTSAPVPTPAHVSVPTSAPTPTSSRVPVPTSSRVPVPTSAPVPASAPVPTSAPVSDVVSALLNLKNQRNKFNKLEEQCITYRKTIKLLRSQVRRRNKKMETYKKIINALMERNIGKNKYIKLVKARSDGTRTTNIELPIDQRNQMASQALSSRVKKKKILIRKNMVKSTAQTESAHNRKLFTFSYE